MSPNLNINQISYKFSGLCKSKVDIERLCGTSHGPEHQFRFVLPYCSKKLKWEVIFDLSVPWFAPDFRFDDDSFLSNDDEDILEKQLPSLAHWDEHNPTSLSNVLSEMINLYKIHQVNILLCIITRLTSA